MIPSNRNYADKISEKFYCTLCVTVLWTTEFKFLIDCTLGAHNTKCSNTRRLWHKYWILYDINQINSS